MTPLLTHFSPQPGPAERPTLLNSPFDAEEPPALARRAAEEVMAQLRAGYIGPDVPTAALHGPEGGKMFGVLVVEDADGHVGYLKSFSGQLLRAWDVEGWTPPVFDRQARAEVEAPGEARVKELTRRVEETRSSPEWGAVEAALRQLELRQAEEARGLKARHAENKRWRDAERARPGAPADRDLLAKLSQRDDVELRREKARWRAERQHLESQRKRLTRRLAALERLRRLVSQEVSWQLYDTYQFQSARGRRLSLRALFEPRVPSSGTGDCAAPKLLVHALRHGLRPLALAEFWWGAPPPGGGRVQGAFYPACKDKCGPLLPFLLDGLDVAPSRRYRPPDLAHHELPVVYEDERMVVVLKPEGLLSVPGTDESVTDSVLERLKQRYPAATGPLLVHRLDVETSGLLVAAKDALAHAALQKQFIERTVKKTYVALLDGPVERPEGVIELPLRVDLEQRPRQVVDFEHGKPAVTRFRVLGTSAGRARVAFFPETGRTHQLRVHASHPRGLGVPIVGDRLYGRPERRLMLHAQALRLKHPARDEVLELEAPAPF
ncbi:MAG: pseudouridine synthase [Myxococcota bacterium]